MRVRHLRWFRFRSHSLGFQATVEGSNFHACISALLVFADGHSRRRFVSVEATIFFLRGTTGANSPQQRAGNWKVSLILLAFRNKTEQPQVEWSDLVKQDRGYQICPRVSTLKANASVRSVSHDLNKW